MFVVCNVKIILFTVLAIMLICFKDCRKTKKYGATKKLIRFLKYYYF